MLPDRSTRVPVPASAYVPRGAGWGPVLVRLIYDIIFWLLSLWTSVHYRAAPNVSAFSTCGARV